jgi:hypothetical protein
MPLTWGEETPEMRDQMQWQAMAAPNSPEEAMQILQMTSIAPNAQPRTEAIGPAGKAAITPGEAVWKRRMRPEHRQAVKRFFQTDH